MAAAIANHAGMSPLLIGMTIVSLGTSAPEIVVSIMASLSGSGELAVGNALGSNITNIGLVLGVTLLMRSIAMLLISSVTPSTSPMLVMFEPSALPTASSPDPDNDAMMDTTISGADVPSETMVIPISSGDMPA